MASLVSQLTPEVSQLWVSTGLTASGLFCVVLLRSWFDFHSTCCQFARHDSGRFLARLRLRCGSSLPMLGHFAGTAFPFSFTIDSIVDKVIYMGCVCRHCYTSIQRLVGQRSSLQSWACLCLMSFQLADGANPGPDYLGSTDECLGPGGDSSANNGTSMSWLVPVLCSAISLFATWVVRKWWKFLPPATTMEEVDYATLGSAFDRINSENNCLRREVSSLNGALSELFPVVGRLREDLDGITADHDRLAERKLDGSTLEWCALEVSIPIRAYQSNKDSKFLPGRDGT